jgi:hypothetical protein
LLRRTTVLMIFHTRAQTRLYLCSRRSKLFADACHVRLVADNHNRVGNSTGGETRRRCSACTCRQVPYPWKSPVDRSRAGVNSCCGSTFSAKKRAYQSLVLNVIYRALVERMIVKLSQSRYSRDLTVCRHRYAPLLYMSQVTCVCGRWWLLYAVA